jgi:hypothetical protein
LVNGEEVPSNPWASKVKAEDIPQLALRAGEKCEVRVEFKKGEKGGRLRLGWSSKSQSFEVIPAHQLSYLFNPKTPDEESVTTPVLSKGIWLRNGSFLAGDFVSSDGSSSQVNFAGQTGFNLFNQKIAKVLFRNSRRPIRFELAAGHTGVFLQNGDFLASEFDGLKGKSLQVTSVLFGRRTFNLENPEVLALVLNSPSPEPQGLQLKLLDGSVLNVASVAIAQEQWVVREGLLGRLTIPETEIAELKNTRFNVTPGESARK